MGQREKLNCNALQLGPQPQGNLELQWLCRVVPSGTRELGFYPTVLVSGYGPPLEGGETQDQVRQSPKRADRRRSSLGDIHSDW